MVGRVTYPKYEHLRMALERAGSVRTWRCGRERVFAFNAAAIDEASRYLERVSREWDQNFTR